MRRLVVVAALAAALVVDAQRHRCSLLVPEFARRRIGVAVQKSPASPACFLRLPELTQTMAQPANRRKPRVFATNRLVVLVPRANPARIRSVYDLRRKGVKVVIGDKSVPIGSYTRQILDALGITNDVLANVVSQETDVKGIVAKVALGEADAGFAYSTDARAVARKVEPIGLPAWSQPPIRYEIAVVRSSARGTAARAFVARVLSKRGRLELRRAGFGLPR